MRKTGVKLAMLGALAGGVLLTGCMDGGRSASLVAQEDYYPSPEPSWPRQRGVDTGLTWTLPKAGSAAGGSGVALAASALPVEEDPAVKDLLWLRQDFRVPYPPATLEALVAMDLGSGKPLRANAGGRWVQGTYAVEFGSGASHASTVSTRRTTGARIRGVL